MWKINHELLAGPPPKGKKARAAKPVGKKRAKSKPRAKSAAKGKRRAATPAKPKAAPKRAKRTTRRSANAKQLRLLD